MCSPFLDAHCDKIDNIFKSNKSLAINQRYNIKFIGDSTKITSFHSIINLSVAINAIDDKTDGDFLILILRPIIYLIRSKNCQSEYLIDVIVIKHLQAIDFISLSLVHLYLSEIYLRNYTINALMCFYFYRPCLLFFLTLVIFCSMLFLTCEIHPIGMNDV